ncbi:hypothetical protein RFI_06815 [Reticulomyxa filosa]|uniref:Uncharacterized protein n=1 Tax=Reticulomyxa filosa TaxID=46433 RepID=X6NVG8_RETFI|nr:hypothetical protein RFI_06815 [Reticulomyxa filosa]|eukprot:ETO30305.1 hypothetical protein RFI_06815 [Reticulomyxa filosa]
MTTYDLEEDEEERVKELDLDSEADEKSIVRAKRRLRPGMRSEELFNWPIEEYWKKQGLLANQEYIQEMIRKNPKNVVDILALPKYQDNTFTDKMQWLYEHFRQFFTDISQFLVHLQHDKGNIYVIKINKTIQVCNKRNCPKMQATEKFRYRCAAHAKPKDCSAMSYAVHTIDDFSKKFQNKKEFPSRYGNKISQESMKQFNECARRVYRIFAHAYHHHEEEFTKYEDEYWLCSRFITFVYMYKLIPISHLEAEAQIPPKALLKLSTKEWAHKVGDVVTAKNYNDENT